MLKKFIIYFVLGLITTTTSFSLTAHPITYQFLTDYIPDAPVFKCANPGNICLVVINLTPFRIPGAISDVNPSGRFIAFTISDVSEYNTPDSELGSPFYTDGISKSFYTFREGMKIRIDEAPEDPTLIGLEFNIGGYTTDVNGGFQVYIPF